MKYRYKAREQELETFIDKAIGFIYSGHRTKHKLNPECGGTVEASNIVEATALAKRTIRKFHPNCSLVNIYEVEE